MREGARALEACAPGPHFKNKNYHLQRGGGEGGGLAYEEEESRKESKEPFFLRVLVTSIGPGMCVPVLSHIPLPTCTPLLHPVVCP